MQDLSPSIRRHTQMKVGSSSTPLRRDHLESGAKDPVAAKTLTSMELSETVIGGFFERQPAVRGPNTPTANHDHQHAQRDKDKDAVVPKSRSTTAMANPESTVASRLKE